MWLCLKTLLETFPFYFPDTFSAESKLFLHKMSHFTRMCLYLGSLHALVSAALTLHLIMQPLKLALHTLRTSWKARAKRNIMSLNTLASNTLTRHSRQNSQRSGCLCVCGGGGDWPEFRVLTLSCCIAGKKKTKKTSAPFADDMRVKSFRTAQDDVCLYRIISLTNSAERVEVGVPTENMTGSKDAAWCLL